MPEGYPNVSVIPATKSIPQGGSPMKKKPCLRVAAYCRVSTGDESQQTSYTHQKAFYTGLIQSRPGWQLAGIYADEAISGTSRAHRDAFNRMMDDAKNGALDYIITKSISRFARNTVDTLNCVRELRQHVPPIGVYFEKENIDTLDAAGELILTILSALAQDESRSISDNIRWTFQKKFQKGIPQINLKRMLGYDEGPDGSWVINPIQARTIRYIYHRFIEGSSANAIAKELNQLKLYTVNGRQWSASTVLTVLRNEKYTGDLEMQKTITEDFLTHRSIKNNGEAPKYYVKDHHPPIIDRTTWEKVQIRLNPPEPDTWQKDILQTSSGPDHNDPQNISKPWTEEHQKFSDKYLISNDTAFTDTRFYNTDARAQGAENLLTPASNDPSFEPLSGKMENFDLIGHPARFVSGREEPLDPETSGHKKPGPKASHFRILKCGTCLTHTGDICGSGFFRISYSNAASGYSDERSLAATGGDTSLFTEKYMYAHPVWRCRRKYGHPAITCPSKVLNECALEQSFMEMLYTIKQDYMAHGDHSEICRKFQAAYAAVYDHMRIHSIQIQRLETMDTHIQEIRKTLNHTIQKQVDAVLDEVLKKIPSLSQELDDGLILMEDIQARIRSNLTPEALYTAFGIVPEEDSEISIYAGLVRDLRQRLSELLKERNTLEREKEELIPLKKNFDFFLKCLDSLPTTNSAGLPLRIHGLGILKQFNDQNDSHQSDLSGTCIDHLAYSHSSEHSLPNPVSEDVANAPDYLIFDRSIYQSCFLQGIVLGDEIQYKTSFGVTLTCSGNHRTLKSFIGFRRCSLDGTIELLDTPYKVNGRKVQYHRYLKNANNRTEENTTCKKTKHKDKNTL